MMRGAAVEAAKVDVGFGGLREALEKIFEKFDGEVADSLRFDFCVNDAVRAADEIKHVIEEANAGGDFGFAAAVEREAEANVGFGGDAVDGGGAAHAPFFQVR